MDTKIADVEVMKEARPRHRRQFSAEEKRRMLDEAATPGESVSSVARRYGVADAAGRIDAAQGLEERAR